MKKGLIVMLISFLAIGCNSTRNFMNEADSLIANGQYEDALFYLKKSFDLKADEATGRKIANTYFELRDFNQAEFWYKWIRLNSDFSVSDYYILAEILIGNSKYDDAKLVLEDLASFDESQTSSFKWQNLVKVIFESPDIYNAVITKQIRPFSILNSPFSDFGYFALNENKYFLSNRVNRKLGKKNNGKNYEESILNPFFKIYEFKSNGLNEQKDSLSISKSTILENVYHLGPIFINDSIFAYTYSSEKPSRSSGNLKLVNPQIRVYQNDKEINLISSSSSSNFFITDPFYSATQNRMYFSANFPDSFGGLDIYYIENKSNNEWSSPINCGPRINSFGDERSPFYSGDILYFSSNGRGGLGGFDIYKTGIGLEVIESPENMGIPYNSSKDDLFFFIDSYNNNLEVLTSDRDGGIGFDDIYYVSNKHDFISLEKVFRVLDITTKKPLANTSIKMDSSDIVFSDSSGYSKISYLNNNSLIKFSKENYYSKIIDISSLLSLDSINVELERIGLENSFAYFGIDSLDDFQSSNKQLEDFLKRSVLNLKENPEYFLRYMIHSDSENINYLDDFINTINQFLIKEGDFSGRVNFLYFSNYYPLLNKNIAHSFSQVDLNNRLEFEIFKEEKTNSTYFFPNFYFSDSSFFSLSNPESITQEVGEAQEQFKYVSEFRDLKTNTPNFSIIVASLSSLIDAKNEQKILKKKYPRFNFDVINPTLISKRYRISVYNSFSLDELNENIEFYFENLNINGIWILEH